MHSTIYNRMLSRPLQVEWAGWRTDICKPSQIITFNGGLDYALVFE